MNGAAVHLISVSANMAPINTHTFAPPNRTHLTRNVFVGGGWFFTRHQFGARQTQDRINLASQLNLFAAG